MCMCLPALIDNVLSVTRLASPAFFVSRSQVVTANPREQEVRTYSMAAADEGEDDYMSMTFGEPEPTVALTSLQKQQLKRKEAELRGRPKSKKELEAEAEAKRQAALNTTLDPSNKGAKLLAKLGYKGGALGKSENARTQPIEVSVKDDRGGIGMDNEKKRKIREYMEAVQGKQKQQKADEGEFRERNRREREAKRHEGMMWGAMKVAEKLDTEAEEERRYQKRQETKDAKSDEDKQSAMPSAAGNRPKVNILWRNLEVQRVEREREQKLRRGLIEGLSMRNRQEDPDEDADDKIALGTEVEELEEEEDLELDEFNALEPKERLDKIVEYLRDTYNYCFYCKYQYPDSDMEGCPGLTEEEHD